MKTKNLLKFTEFLEGFDGEFDLDNYDLMISLLEKCGFKGEEGDDWLDFSERIFDLDFWSHEWDWCFNEQWRNVDNSAFGCAIRIRILLDDGLPENWFQQMWEIEPLSYNLEDLKLIKEIEKVLE